MQALLEAVPNLSLLETVDSEKLANKLDSTGGHLGVCCASRLPHSTRLKGAYLYLLKEKTLLPQPSCRVDTTHACTGHPRTLRTTLPPLPSAVAALGRPPLAVFVQVNTSGEESKYGVEPQVGANWGLDGAH